MISDARLAIRSLMKKPGTSLVLVLTLATGLAANAVIFNLLDAVVLRAFDYPHVDRLVRLWETFPRFDGIERGNVAPANLLDWREQAKGAVDHLGALEWWEPNLRGEQMTERLQGYRVTPGFFETLGVSLPRGRGFLAEEGRPGQDRRLVLGHDLWQRSFGGDGDVVGGTVTVDGEPYEVVGIAPRGFRFPDGAEAWAPLVLPAPAEASRDEHYLSVYGRLAPGRDLDDARAALAVVAMRLEHDHPDTNSERGVGLASFTLGFGDPAMPTILAIWQTAAFLVLLIACVNVANLLLARGAERRREMALRMALGAGPRRIAAQLLTEGMVLAGTAVLVALPLVTWGTRALRENMPAEIARFVPGWSGISADWRSLLFSAALAAVATVVFSAVPALRAARSDPGDALREGGRTLVGGGSGRGRSLLVVGQVAAALALVVTAALAVRAARALVVGPQGYDPDGVLTFEVSLSESRYPDDASRRAFARDARARLGDLAGVTDVGVGSSLPGRGGYQSSPIEVEGEPLPARQEAPEVDFNHVSIGYFRALGQPVLAGRGFDERDGADGLAVAIVSRSMAERFWPGQDPLGRRFRVAEDDAPWLRVVGVAGDVIQHWATRRNSPTFYRPLLQAPRRGLAFALRTRGEPEAVADDARRALATVDADQPAFQMMSMRRSISNSTIGLQYVAGVMAALAALALVLAVSGVYGVMSYRVTQRTPEIGVRVALGASRLDVLRLVLGHAIALAAIGLALGAALAVGAGRLVSATLLGAVRFDGRVLAATTAMLLVAAVLAAWVPSWGALRLDPARVLRAE
jgi:putative ABC transport system permease protein